MKNYVVESYENYNEESRFDRKSKRIEFLTTCRILDETIGQGKTILDCSAGTGAYAFYLADKGHTVTTTDITPRHIEYINNLLETKNYTMKTAVMDATDLSVFKDETFDVVLNMGPIYHLTDKKAREKNISECVRVLKKDGLLFTAYIPRFYVFQHVSMRDEKYLKSKLAKQLVETGVLMHDDEDCFWTDTYYSSAEEMEALYSDNTLHITDHFAQDGITSLFDNKVDNWTDEQYKIWCDYHYSICREKSILGASNHVIIVGRK